MINIHAAYRLAKQHSSGTIRDCVELKSYWAFYFSENEATPGLPYLLINKESGDIDYICIPPISNLKLIQSGVKVDIEKVLKP